MRLYFSRETPRSQRICVLYPAPGSGPFACQVLDCATLTAIVESMLCAFVSKRDVDGV